MAEKLTVEQVEKCFDAEIRESGLKDVLGVGVFRPWGDRSVEQGWYIFYQMETWDDTAYNYLYVGNTEPTVRRAAKDVVAEAKVMGVK